MGLKDKVREVLFIDDDDNHTRFRLFEVNHCTFEVFDDGRWHKVDIRHPWPELYEDEGVPEDVVKRVESAVDSDEGWNSWQVPYDEYVKHYEDLLRAEFDDVRFLGTDYVPGAIY